MTFKWIRVVDEQPIDVEPEFKGLKGVSFKTEYGPPCDCDGFVNVSSNRVDSPDSVGRSRDRSTMTLDDMPGMDLDT